MKRRSLIATTATLATLSGCLDEYRGGPDADESGSSERTGPPFDVTTVDAPGSEAGTVSVPTADQVQLVNFARIHCPTSQAMLSRVGEAEERLEEELDVGPEGTVLVITVVDGSAEGEPTESDLADWWVEHDGDWTVGLDEDGALVDHHDVSGYPTTVAIDGRGEVHWRDKGGTTASNLLSGVETALEESDGGEKTNETED